MHHYVFHHDGGHATRSQTWEYIAQSAELLPAEHGAEALGVGEVAAGHRNTVVGHEVGRYVEITCEHVHLVGSKESVPFSAYPATDSAARVFVDARVHAVGGCGDDDGVQFGETKVAW